MFTLASWKRTRQPSPGAMAYAFYYNLYLPPSASMGLIYNRGLKPLPGAPQVFSAAGQTTSGYGGLQAGNLYLQGLIDPNQQQPGNV